MLWHDPDERADLLAGRRARPLDRRAVARRTAAPAGPRPAPRREARVPRRARHLRRRLRNGSHDEAVAETFPASDPTDRAGTRRASPEPVAGRDAGRASSARATGERAGSTARRSSSSHGAVVIAAITSCTNTSNPPVMIGAGLLAKKAVERGLHRKPWVKSSLAPGSKVVTEYYEKAGLTPYLEAARLPHRRLRLHDVHRQLRARCPRRSRRRSREGDLVAAPCSPATATSRPASTPR